MRLRRAAVGLALAGLAGAPGPSQAGVPDPHIAKVTLRPGSSARPVRGGGALLQWRTSRESANVGFDVHRARSEPGRGRSIVPRLVAGTALRIGPTRARTKTTTYRRFDPEGRRGDRYFIRDYDLSGRARWHGPYVVRGRSVARRPSSPLLPRTPAPGGPGGRPTVPTPGAPPIADVGPAGPVPIAEPSPALDPQTSPEEVQAAIATRQTVRLGVLEDGWTRIGLDVLRDRGLDTSAPERLHVYTGGREVRALVVDGGLEFYGQGVDELDTGTRAYFVDAQTAPGLRMATAPAGADAPQAPDRFRATARRADRSNYFPGLLNGAASNFFGDGIVGGPLEQGITTPHVADAADARLSVSLQGISARRHEVAVSLNGKPVGTLSFEGRDSQRQTFDAPDLRDGLNAITLTPSAGADFSLVKSISVDYDHTMAADGNRLLASVPAGRRARITGLDAGTARVADVTDPAAPILVPTDADRAVAATAPGSGTRQLLAFDASAVRPPEEVETGMPADLASPDRDGALTVISRPAFDAALEPLVARRRAQGLSVRVVHLQDVYDAYSFGQADHRAVGRMLDVARGRWRTPPAYVLLAGDGSFDPRGFLGRGLDARQMPVALIDTAVNETASDSTLTGTLATGRLPARSAAALSAMVTKQLRYEDAASTRSALLVNDIDDTWDFSGSAAALVPLLPPDMTVTRVQRADEGARGRVLQGAAAGPSLVNWSGHGSVDFWRGGLLTGDDAAKLPNAEHPSFFVMMTCLNGYFVDPTLDALSETLMAAPGGAVAAFSSTGVTVPGPQDAANERLVRNLFMGARLGDAVVASLAGSDDRDVRATWTLFGDPSLVLR